MTGFIPRLLALLNTPSPRMSCLSSCERLITGHANKTKTPLQNSPFLINKILDFSGVLYDLASRQWLISSLPTLLLTQTRPLFPSILIHVSSDTRLACACSQPRRNAQGSRKPGTVIIIPASLHAEKH